MTKDVLTAGTTQAGARAGNPHGAGFGSEIVLVRSGFILSHGAQYQFITSFPHKRSATRIGGRFLLKRQ